MQKKKINSVFKRRNDLYDNLMTAIIGKYYADNFDTKFNIFDKKRLLYHALKKMKVIILQIG